MASKKQKSPGSSNSSAEAVIASSGVSAETLQDAPVRALTFLIGAARDDFAARALEAVGFDEAAREEGAGLVQACILTGKKAPSANAAGRAVVAVNEWDEGGFRLVRSALGRKFPAQYATLTDGLAASTDGVEAVRGVTTLLERIAKLEKGSAADKAAVAALAARGIDAAERKRLADLCNTARGLDASKNAKQTEKEKAAADLAYFTALANVYAWFIEWADAAHAVVSRKRSLIALGLASKKESKKEAPAPVPAPAPEPKKLALDAFDRRPSPTTRRASSPS